ncbi:MAG: hypothetical protein QM736_24315 [Vicinamibacterales bacterium]
MWRGHVRTFGSTRSPAEAGHYESTSNPIEINPLVVTSHDDLLALDAKVNFDDTALYRHHFGRALKTLRVARRRRHEVQPK